MALSAPNEAICCAAVAPANRCELRVWSMLARSGRTITGILAKRVTFQSHPSITQLTVQAWTQTHACPTTWPRDTAAWRGAKVESLKRNCAQAAQASADVAAGGRTRWRIQLNLARALDVGNKRSNDINTSALPERNSAFEKQMGFLFWGIIADPTPSDVCEQQIFAWASAVASCRKSWKYTFVIGGARLLGGILARFSSMCTVHFSFLQKHLHWTELRNLIWSSRTENSVLLSVFLGVVQPLGPQPPCFGKGSWKSQQSGDFSPLEKKLWFWSVLQTFVSQACPHD